MWPPSCFQRVAMWSVVVTLHGDRLLCVSFFPWALSPFFYVPVSGCERGCHLWSDHTYPIDEGWLGSVQLPTPPNLQGGDHLYLIAMFRMADITS